MGINRLKSNIIDSAINQFDQMRRKVKKGTKGYHRQHEAINSLETAYAGGGADMDRKSMDKIFNSMKQHDNTMKYGNSAHPKNPNNPTKYNRMGENPELTRSSRAGTGDIATDGEAYIGLESGQRGTVIKPRKL